MFRLLLEEAFCQHKWSEPKRFKKIAHACFSTFLEQFVTRTVRNCLVLQVILTKLKKQKLMRICFMGIPSILTCLETCSLGLSVMFSKWNSPSKNRFIYASQIFFNRTAFQAFIHSNIIIFFFWGVSFKSCYVVPTQWSVNLFAVFIKCDGISIFSIVSISLYLKPN